MKCLYPIAFMSLFVLQACQQKHEVEGYAGAVEVECRKTFPSQREFMDYCGCMFLHLNGFILQNSDLEQAIEHAVEKAGQNAGSARILEFVPRDTKEKLLKQESYIRSTYCASKKP